jgi:hypothetical protein
VAVHVYSAVKINGDDFHQLISPKTDLASVKRSLHNDWILPRTPPVAPVDPPRMPECKRP